MRALLAAILAIAFAAVGVLVAGGVSGRQRARMLVPISGLLLAGVAVFGLIPELVRAIGWLPGLLLVGAGYGLLSLLDRMGLPVCPSCTHGHGFSAPLVAATAAHAFADGWGMMAVTGMSTDGVSMAISTAILLHKIPEGLALGTMLRQSAGRADRAIVMAVLAELPTVLGGAAGLWETPARWVQYPLALAGGTFLFLGLHAMQQWKMNRPRVR